MSTGNISSLGIGSGFELQDILAKLRSVDEAPITSMQEKKTEVEDRLAEFDIIKSKLFSMKSHALSLSLSSNFLERDISISDEDILTATVLIGSAETSNSIEVKSLASRSSWQTEGVESADTPATASDTTFSYSLGDGGEPVTISVDAGTTITELAGLINDYEDNPGITASVIDDGTGVNPYRLVLTSNASGEDNRIFIDTMMANLTEAQGAEGASLNAEVEVNGITYQRQTNTGIDDILQGITLNLKNAGVSSVNVTADKDLIQSNITGLVESFNDLVQEIKVNSTYDEATGEWGILSLSSSMKRLDDELIALMGATVDTVGSITSMYDLGMETNRDGTVTIDEEALTQAISSDPDGIMALFLGDDDAGITGLGDIINDGLRDMTRVSGLINTQENAAKDEINRLETNIEAATERLDRRYATMTQKFVMLDMYVGRIQSESAYLTSVFESLNNTNEK